MQKKPIHFFFEGVRPYLPQRKALQSFIARIARMEGKKINYINYIFTTDADLLRINEEYLQHYDYTDIITFQLNDAGQPLEADIFISTERVKENAQLLNTTFTRELHRVIFHGVLHLCGYKDKTPQQRHLMRQQEDKYLRLYFGQ